MRTALLISGYPRFHAEFDQQLANLHGSAIDWIVVFWKNQPQDIDHTVNAYITPSWSETVTDEATAVQWLNERIPPHHNLAHFSFVDWNDFPSNLVHDYPNQVPGTNPEAIFRQYWMVQQVNAASKHYAPYDLVIRSRQDLGVETPLYLDKIYNKLIDEPMRIVTPSNHRQGLGLNDQFAIGLPHAMDLYAKVVYYFNEMYFYKNATMHPENIVSHALVHQGIYWGTEECVVHLRQRGKYLTKNFTSGVPYYAPDFGRW